VLTQKDGTPTKNADTRYEAHSWRGAAVHSFDFMTQVDDTLTIFWRLFPAPETGASCLVTETMTHFTSKCDRQLDNYAFV